MTAWVWFLDIIDIICSVQFIGAKQHHISSMRSHLCFQILHLCPAIDFCFFYNNSKNTMWKKGYLDLFQCLIQAVMCCWNYYEFTYKWCHHLSILKVNQTHTHTVTTGGKLITTTHFQAKLPFNKSKRLRGKTHNQELRNSNITTFTVKQVEMFFFSFFCPFQTWNT